MPWRHVAEQRRDGRRRHRLLACQQHTQRRFHLSLALVRRQLQDRQVFLVRTGTGPQQQSIVGHAKITRREQGRTIPVVREGARLAHQPVDEVPIVDVVLVTSTQPWQPFHQLLRVPHFQVLHIHTHVHTFADQAARHRVGIPLDVNQAATVHARRHLFACFQPPRRQRLQLGQFLQQTLASPCVELI
jgi:hypothetical protein